MPWALNLGFTIVSSSLTYTYFPLWNLSWLTGCRLQAQGLVSSWVLQEKDSMKQHIVTKQNEELLAYCVSLCVAHFTIPHFSSPPICTKVREHNLCSYYFKTIFKFSPKYCQVFSQASSMSDTFKELLTVKMLPLSFLYGMKELLLSSNWSIIFVL